LCRGCKMMARDLEVLEAAETTAAQAAWLAEHRG
jgi:hypothetical protein